MTHRLQKASRSYQKDLASFQEARDSNEQTLDGSIMPGDWEYESSSGYYYNKETGFYYDSNSGFYYTDALGKWVTKEEARAASRASSTSSIQKNPSFGKPPVSVASAKSTSTIESGPPPGRVITTPVNPKRPMKGATSSVAVKRKKTDEKPKVVSKEEAAALKAREAARRRVEEREKPLLGLYKH